MPPLPPPTVADSDYDSAADSDFAASVSPSSGEESDTVETAGTTKQRIKDADGDGDVGMGSGDEGIVAQGMQKKRRKGKGKEKVGDAEGNVGDEDGDGEGGVGIRVRLRSGRGGEDTKKATLPNSSGATIDINSVWARLNAPKSQQSPTKPPEPTDPLENAENIPPPETRSPSTATNEEDLPKILQSPSTEQTITIPHTYTFAGQTHTSQKTVPASSPEAQAYLASTKDHAPPTTTSTPTGPPLRRPLARKNLLEPNPQTLVSGTPRPPRADLPPTIGGQGTRSLTTEAKASAWDLSKEGKKAIKKLNTVEKSKLDWEAEVERQGIREELDRAEKSGGSYLGRREFLERVEGKGEDEARAARLKVAGITAG